MSEFIQETPLVVRSYCPVCESDIVHEEACYKSTEGGPCSCRLQMPFRCSQHPEDRDGADDGRVVSTEYLSGSAEAGGPENKAMCDFFHRGKRR